LFQDITVEELLEMQRKRELTLIDVRSPGEYEEFAIPGSLNIPLFTDEERREIGILYKQVSIQAAKDRGLEIVAAKLPAFIKQFERIPERKAVYCWRGGMRSKTTATVLSLMGIRVYRLLGGIRAYRKWVHDTLEHFDFKPTCVVINGYTGTGKTEILRRLAASGYPVLDLEAMAGHRGSIFGQIGLKPNNQKTFESLLVQDLIKYKDSPYVLIEAESKRIGKAVLPEFLVEAKERGIQIFLEMPKEQRVRHIIEEYKPEQHKQECIEAFAYIKKRIHTPIAAQIERHLLLNEFAEAVSLMLEYYYDPRYSYAGQHYERLPIVCKVQDLDDAVAAVIKQIEKLF
jgi:tRNA 2-selenouridine synthase